MKQSNQCCCWCCCCLPQGEWSEEELTRLREVYGEIQESMLGAEEKVLVQQMSDHFPHRGVRGVARKMREEGWLQGKSSKKRTGGSEREAEGTKSKQNLKWKT